MDDKTTAEFLPADPSRPAGVWARDARVPPALCEGPGPFLLTWDAAAHLWHGVHECYSPAEVGTYAEIICAVEPPHA